MDPEQEVEDISLLVPELQDTEPDKREKARLAHFASEENRKVCFFAASLVDHDFCSQTVVHQAVFVLLHTQVSLLDAVFEAGEIMIQHG